MIPVRTSPIPPEAIPALPVGLINTLPSGCAITVQAPFRITWTLKPAAKSRAHFIRLCWTAPMPIPIRRAISPGWGVKMTGALALLRICAWPARLFNPSASTTSGIEENLTILWTSFRVFSACPRPGPMATHFFPAIKFFIVSKADSPRTPG